MGKREQQTKVTHLRAKKKRLTIYAICLIAAVGMRIYISIASKTSFIDGSLLIIFLIFLSELIEWIVLKIKK